MTCPVNTRWAPENSVGKGSVSWCQTPYPGCTSLERYNKILFSVLADTVDLLETKEQLYPHGYTVQCGDWAYAYLVNFAAFKWDDREVTHWRKDRPPGVLMVGIPWAGCGTAFWVVFNERLDAREFLVYRRNAELVADHSIMPCYVVTGRITN